MARLNFLKMQSLSVAKTISIFGSLELIIKRQDLFTLVMIKCFACAVEVALHLISLLTEVSLQVVT